MLVWTCAYHFICSCYDCSVNSVCADVILSGIGTIAWTAALITWITIFQLHRAEWGATADQISFIIPTGIP